MKLKKILIVGSLLMWILFIVIGSLDISHNILNKEYSMDLTQSLYVYEDINNEYDLGGAIGIPSEKYRVFNDSGYAGKLSKSTYWFKLDIDSIEPNKIMELSKAQLAMVEFYQVDDVGNIVNKDVQGRDLPFNDRKIKNRYFIFELMPSEVNTSVYFRVETDTYLQMPLALWEFTDYFNYNLYSNILYGIFYGMLLIMLFYNLILGISLKDINYYLYVCLVVSYFFLQLVWDGFAYQYLWSNSPAWDLISNPVFMLCTTLSMLAFTYSFLKLQSFKYLRYAYHVILLTNVLSFISMFLLPINILIYISMLIGAAVIVYCLVGLFIKRLSEVSDMIYLVAVELLFIGGSLNILAGIGILPYTIITAYATKAGGIALLLLFSIALSTRIKNIEYQREIESKKRKMLKIFHDINKKITTTRDIHQISEYVISHFINILSCNDGLIVLLDSAENLDIRVFKSDKLGFTIRLDENQINHLKNYITVAKVSYSKGFEFDYIMVDPNAHVMIIPLINSGDEVGAIVLSCERISILESNIEEALMDYAKQITINIGNIKELDEVTKSSRTDELTQINNRRRIFELSDHYYEKEYIDKPFAVIMLDIDYFKQINDSYGHAVGDQLMEQVAQKINTIVTGRGEVGRYGGDEFMIILPNLSIKSAYDIANEVCAGVYNTDFLIDNRRVHSLNISLSIGVAYRSQRLETIEELCEYGDIALYKAKELGRNQVVVYDEDISKMDIS